MDITILKCKLHQACVTHAELYYDGSCAIDGALLAAAGIHQYEQIQIYNINNGARFTTYAISTTSHSGIISVNGAAARKASPGDRIIICAYATLNKEKVGQFQPTLIYLDQDNNIIQRQQQSPVQAV